MFISVVIFSYIAQCVFLLGKRKLEFAVGLICEKLRFAQVI